MKQNFAGQPDGGGALGYAGPLPTLTGLDLMSDISKPQSAIFRPDPRFVDNCKTKNSMKNFDSYAYEEEEDIFYNDTPSRNSGSSFSLGDWNLADLFKTGSNIFITTQQNKALQEQAALALQIEQQKKERAKAEAAAKLAESGSVTSKIKAYTTPIIIVGVLTIGGIAAYFYFKKKKIS
jgi:hypothetical protein